MTPRGGRRKNGTGVAEPKPFAIFIGKGAGVSVRIAKTKWCLAATEVIVSAAPVHITRTEHGLLMTGEGVVRQHKTTIAVTG